MYPVPLRCRICVPQIRIPILVNEALLPVHSVRWGVLPPVGHPHLSPLKYMVVNPAIPLVDQLDAHIFQRLGVELLPIHKFSVSV